MKVFSVIGSDPSEMGLWFHPMSKNKNKYFYAGMMVDVFTYYPLWFSQQNCGVGYACAYNAHFFTFL